MRRVRRGWQSEVEPLQQRVLLSTVFTVSNTDDSGSGSLRNAILFANSNPSVDILFDLGTGVQTISLLSALPAITKQVNIRGTTDSAGNPLVRLDGSQAGADVSGLTFARNTAGNTKPSTVAGLIIGGFSKDGIDISGNAPTNVFGCRIGTGPGGNSANPNGVDGIHVSTTNCQIGLAGTTNAFRTIISGNTDDGIEIATGAFNTIVQNCLIGTNAAGKTDVGNGGTGIEINDTQSLIGGRRAHQGNVISGNLIGLGINFGNCDILGNFIGTDITGTLAIQNNNSGIFADGVVNVSIGDSTKAGRNIISGNGLHGIAMTSSTNFTIDNNIVGADATRTKPLGNAAQGILLFNGSQATIHNNLIAGSGGSGITLTDTSKIIASDNFIGISSDLKHALPNANGVTLLTHDNFLFSNTIADNMQMGVQIQLNTSVANHLSANSIFSNGGLGIQLGNSSTPLPNHTGSVAGPNDNQNYPVLTSAVVTSVNTTVSGTLNSLPNSFFAIEFFANDAADPSGFGEGQRFIGSTNVQTDGNGDASFNVELDRVGKGQFITATAVNITSSPADGDTSEFSQAISVTGAKVSGRVFNDANNNGKIDTGESGLKRRTVFIDIEKSGQFDADLNPFALTDSQGRYTIFGVSPGTARVRLLGTNGFAQTIPSPSAAFIDVTVTGQDTTSNVRFAQHKSSATPATLAIDAGSSSPYTDLNGQTFAKDPIQDNKLAAFNVKGTDDDPLYYIFASGQTIHYKLTVPNGKYRLKLFFVDSTSTAAGQRVFNVTANGKKVLTNFDIFATAKTKNKAVITTSNLTIANKKLDLQFAGVVEHAIVSAFELIPV